MISAAEKSSVSVPRTTAPPRLGSKVVQAPAREEVPPFASVEAMEAEFHRRFLASPGFGRSRIQRPVFLAPTPALVHNGTTYRVVPPDLIGLEDEPAVYAAHEHAFPNPKATNSSSRQLFSTRPMSALETNAVAAIRGGRELVVTPIAQTDPSAHAAHPAPDLLVVGALRADTSCAKCHQCDEGRLLGAFTYTLKPIGKPAAVATNLPAILSRL